MVSQVDVTGISYFLPILSFLIVFVLGFAVLQKTKLVENKFLQLLLAFLIATVFVSVAGTRNFILAIVPWFAILLVLLLLVLMLTGFVGKPAEFLTKGIGVVFVILFGLAVLISAIFVFQPYYAGSSLIERFKDWVYSSNVFGAILLLVISAIASWILVKGK